MNSFEKKKLPVERDYVAPDGSDVRALLGLEGGALAHFEIAPGQTSVAVAHRTVSEIWYFLEGRGEMWRKLNNEEQVVPVEPEVCITIPVGTHFQFRSLGSESLSAIGVTMPPWSGDGEAYEVSGKWTPTLTPRGEKLMQSNEDKTFERLRFEHELINRRLTWLLSSQSILFAAYGVAAGLSAAQTDTAAQSDIAGFFLNVTAITGAFISGLILIGVIAGILAKRTVWKDSQQKEFGVRTWTTYLGLVPDTLLPIVFGVAWIFILANS